MEIKLRNYPGKSLQYSHRSPRVSKSINVPNYAQMISIFHQYFSSNFSKTKSPERFHIVWTQLSKCSLLWLHLEKYLRQTTMKQKRELLEAPELWKRNIWASRFFFSGCTEKYAEPVNTTFAFRCSCLGSLWLRGTSGSFSPEPLGLSSSNISISINEFYCLIFLGLLHTFQVVHLSVSVAGQVN